MAFTTKEFRGEARQGIRFRDTQSDELMSIFQKQLPDHLCSAGIPVDCHMDVVQSYRCLSSRIPTLRADSFLLALSSTEISCRSRFWVSRSRTPPKTWVNATTNSSISRRFHGSWMLRTRLRSCSRPIFQNYKRSDQAQKGEVRRMARCYYLDYKSNSLFGNAKDKYYCKLCGKQFSVDDPQVKYTCNPSYGEEYKKCPIYQDRR